MKTRTLLLALAFCALCLQAVSAQELERPAEWAVAVSGTSVGNLYRIEDGFYRGAQPTAAGLKELAGLGVRTVLDLAGGPGDGRLIRDDSLKFFHVPMSAWGLHDDLVLNALRIMADPGNRPLMIHCQHGADRTGAMVALYRIVVQGWSKEAAVREMNEGGYHHNSLWNNLDRYVMRADVAALRKALGLGAPAESGTSGAILAAVPAPVASVAAVPIP